MDNLFAITRLDISSCDWSHCFLQIRATCQWAASIRDYLACETITGAGDWMDQLLWPRPTWPRARTGRAKPLVFDPGVGASR